MDGLTLIRAARALGFSLRADGERLVIRGPKSAGAVAQAIMDRKAEIMAMLAAAASEGVRLDWAQDAQDQFLERLGVGDELGMDTSPGAPAWEVAAREARRVEAGLPARFARSREPDLIDEALEAFGPLGGLTFVASLPRDDASAQSGSPDSGNANVVVRRGESANPVAERP
jgi:hypothetical protein